MRKAVIILFGLIFLGFIGTCIYFVGGVSATFPPIKTYQYSGNLEHFEDILKNFALANPNVTYKISIRDSSLAVDPGYRDVALKLKKDTSTISYDLVCEETDSGDENSKTDIKIVAAFNSTNTRGGYSISSPEVKTYIEYFEKQILYVIKRDQHVIINLKPKSFFDRFHY